jgi:hypothetical protein
MIGLGLGVGKGGGPVSAPAIGTVDAVLFERDGNWTGSDISSMNSHSSTTLSLGTADVGGISNYVILNVDSSSGVDAQMGIGSTNSLFSSLPIDYYNTSSGSFKITVKVFIPSSNTSTGAVTKIRHGNTSNTFATSEDTWTVHTRTKTIDSLPSPTSDNDYFEVELEDTTSNEPAQNDQMYVTQFKVEFIAD